MKLALLGRHISHSLSPKLYADIYDNLNVDYQLIDIEDKTLVPSLGILMNDLDGLNITSPYKEIFLNDVKIQQSEIQALNAINCIGKKQGSFYATNTDYTALIRLIPKMACNKKIIILGDGVMSRVVESVCKLKGLTFEVRSRKIDDELFRKFSNGNILEDNSLIINCCSRSYTFNGRLGIDSHFWDLNYRHQMHLDYFHGSQSYTDGYSLLKLQAEDAAAFWSQLKN